MPFLCCFFCIFCLRQIVEHFVFCRYFAIERPEYDGGSMVTQYEVNMINPDGSTRIAFSGYETECLVASLLPGRCYAFQVRASNRIGVRYTKRKKINNEYVFRFLFLEWMTSYFLLVKLQEKIYYYRI